MKDLERVSQVLWTLAAGNDREKLLLKAWKGLLLENCRERCSLLRCSCAFYCGGRAFSWDFGRFGKEFRERRENLGIILQDLHSSLDVFEGVEETGGENCGCGAGNPVD